MPVCIGTVVVEPNHGLSYKRGLLRGRFNHVSWTAHLTQLETPLCLKKRPPISYNVLFAVIMSKPYRDRRSHQWIVLFDCKNTFRCWYDWTCVKWILLCLRLAASLLKIRRNRWRLVRKRKGGKVRRIWKMGKQSRLEQLRSVSCVKSFFIHGWTYI